MATFAFLSPSLFGLVLGGVVAFLYCRARSAGLVASLEAARAEHEITCAELRNSRESCTQICEEKARLEANLDAERRQMEERRSFLEEMEHSLREKFSKAATSALMDNNRQFLELANVRLSAQHREATTELGSKQAAIDELLKPIRETLQKLEAQTSVMELKREGAYQGVLAEIRTIQQTHTDLRKETSQLVAALRSPRVRGDWGELQLKNCIEFAGMLEYCNFDVQMYVRSVDGDGQRPDVIVRLPNERMIVIDAKTPRDAFSEAYGSDDMETRAGKLRQHALQVRQHLDALSRKAYWQQFNQSPDFVVCFLPSEVLFSAALEQDPSLIEYGCQSNVILATPTTLIALLKAIAYGWQQAQVTRNAVEIRNTGQALYKKICSSYAHFERLGDALRKAGVAYDGLLGSVEGRGGIFSQSRKLKELGIGEEELEELPSIGMTLRFPQSDDWQAVDLAAEAGPAV